MKKEARAEHPASVAIAVLAMALCLVCLGWFFYERSWEPLASLLGALSGLITVVAGWLPQKLEREGERRVGLTVRVLLGGLLAVLFLLICGLIYTGTAFAHSAPALQRAERAGGAVYWISQGFLALLGPDPFSRTAHSVFFSSVFGLVPLFYLGLPVLMLVGATWGLRRLKIPAEPQTAEPGFQRAVHRWRTVWSHHWRLFGRFVILVGAAAIDAGRKRWRVAAKRGAAAGLALRRVFRPGEGPLFQRVYRDALWLIRAGAWVLVAWSLVGLLQGMSLVSPNAAQVGEYRQAASWLLGEAPGDPAARLLTQSRFFCQMSGLADCAELSEENRLFGVFGPERYRRPFDCAARVKACDDYFDAVLQFGIVRAFLVYFLLLCLVCFWIPRGRWAGVVRLASLATALLGTWLALSQLGLTEGTLRVGLKVVAVAALDGVAEHESAFVLVQESPGAFQVACFDATSHPDRWGWRELTLSRESYALQQLGRQALGLLEMGAGWADVDCRPQRPMLNQGQCADATWVVGPGEQAPVVLLDRGSDDSPAILEIVSYGPGSLTVDWTERRWDCDPSPCLVDRQRSLPPGGTVQVVSSLVELRFEAEGLSPGPPAVLGGACGRHEVSEIPD